jgi:hypothetical protein
MKTIVSLLSDQLIPNLLFIRQHGNRHSKHLFISTPEMERNHKSLILAETLGLEKESFHILTVDANNPLKIRESLGSHIWDYGTPWSVNITGGTKIMSQMVYNHFASGKFDCIIFYTSISAPYDTILYPEIRLSSKKIMPSLTLWEYFCAHGFSYTILEGFSRPEKDADAIFRKVIQKGGPQHVDMLVRALSDKKMQKDKNYLSGEWFEDWLYLFLKDKLSLEDSQIARGLEIKSRFSVTPGTNDNEIDLAFVVGNRLFLVECKVFFNATVKKINETIYKSASIRQTLGLKATSLMFFCNDITGSGSTIKDKCRLLNVEQPFLLKDMRDLAKFEKQIKKTTGYGS